jgi:hypothetical protein
LNSEDSSSTSKIIPSWTHDRDPHYTDSLLNILDELGIEPVKLPARFVLSTRLSI